MTLLKSTSVTEVNGKKEVMMKKNALLSIVATLSFAAALTLVPSCGKSHPEVFQNEPALDQLSDEESVRPDDEPFDVSADIQVDEEVVQSVMGKDGTKITYQISGNTLKAQWAVGDTIFGIFSSSSKVAYKVKSVDASGKAHFQKLAGTNPATGTRVYMFYAPKTEYYNQLMSGSYRTLTVDLRYQKFDDSQYSSGTYSGRLPTFMTAVATATAQGIHFTFTHQTAVLALVNNTLSNSGSSESVKQIILECTGLQTAGTFTPSGDAINFADDSRTRGAIWLDCANLTAGEMGSRVLFFVLFNGGTSGKMTMTARTPSARYYNVSKSYKSISTGKVYRMTSLPFYERWVIPSGCVDLGIRKAGQSTYYPPVYWRDKNLFFTGAESESVNNYGDYWQWGIPHVEYKHYYTSLPSNRYSNGNTLSVTLNSSNTNRGEVIGYNSFVFPNGWSQAGDGDLSKVTLSRYNSEYRYTENNTYPRDNKTQLDTDSDLAWYILNYQTSNPYYRTPTQAQWQSLKDQTYCQWTTSYKNSSRQGCVIYAAKRAVDAGQWSASTAAPSGLTYNTSNDAHIFLPAAGWITNYNQMSMQILNCAYWTATRSSTESANAVIVTVLSSNPSNFSFMDANRWVGLPVRPIYVPTEKSN